MIENKEDLSMAQRDLRNKNSYSLNAISLYDFNIDSTSADGRTTEYLRQSITVYNLLNSKNRRFLL